MKIALVGDVMLGRLVNKMLKESDSAYPWGDTLSILKKADLRICNLECVLSDIGNPWSTTPKFFHFRSDEKNIKTLQAAKINIVSIANNHVLDYEYDAMLQMIDVLDKEQILHTGAGINFSEASKPAIFEVDNKKIGVIAFTDNEPDWEAEANKPGILYVPTQVSDHRAQDLFKQVVALRQKVDFLIVSAHWGSNWGYSVPREHISMAHALIDAGADLIFGHSAHIFRGIEVYKDRPIIYSAGDFIDDYAVDEIEKNDESFVFMLETDLKSSIKLHLYPAWIDQFKVDLATSYRKKEILLKMESLCRDLGSHLEQFPDHATLEIHTK